MKSYKEAFDLLTEAYINNEVKPYDNCACFIGNLLNKKDTWAWVRGGDIDDGMGELREFCNSPIIERSRLEAIAFVSNNGYSPTDIVNMENNFLSLISKNTINEPMLFHPMSAVLEHENYENALFIAFESTLGMLKMIHESKGEIIDETPKFIKRKLQTV